MSFLLDTSTLSEVLRAVPSPRLVRRLTAIPSGDRHTSVITVSQLLVAARREKDPRLMQDVVRLVASIRVAPYDLAAAQVFARLRATEAADGETDDVMVAAIAVAHDFTLVTRRTEAFSGYKQLRLENWIDP
ncbi:MAG: PIN domain-containing protein [Deltaproteobacteria bacterium]|jgi:tRNA(fMet)-specific endonuclease VapC|nr:PIN domain-containing protein [Deltaproteobacteria bacterium]MBW2536511.1 PIN domain-containing protein [Deltaproteobacteria bacterium]